MHYPITYRLLLLVALCLPRLVWAQEETTTEETSFTVEEGTELNLDPEDEEEEQEESRPRRNEFYGLRTKPMYTTRGQGTRLVRENFYYLRDYVEPNFYVQQAYWYDFRKGQISDSKNIVPEFAGILHGPYRRYVGDSLVEEGNYYLGTRHGRWVEYDRNGILLNKEHWFKGWPKESRMSYYDRAGTKLREVIPVMYGEENGDYYYFYENGLIAVRGQYRFGRRVGVWREFYSHRRQIKREIQYPASPWDWDDGFTPYIIREYDRRGQIIYDREEYQRSVQPPRSRR